MEIRNVTIGDKFKSNGGKSTYEVVDFIELKSMTTNEITGYLCMVKGIGTLAKGIFEVPFATVQRNKII